MKRKRPTKQFHVRLHEHFRHKNESALAYRRRLAVELESAVVEFSTELIESEYPLAGRLEELLDSLYTVLRRALPRHPSIVSKTWEIPQTQARYDIEAALGSALRGDYSTGHMSLRRGLEMFTLAARASMLITGDELPTHWVAGTVRTPPFRESLRWISRSHLARHLRVQAIDWQTELASFYHSLSGHVHVRGREHSHMAQGNSHLLFRGVPLKLPNEVPLFFLLDRTIETIEWIANIAVLAHPLAVVPLPATELFVPNRNDGEELVRPEGGILDSDEARMVRKSMNDLCSRTFVNAAIELSEVIEISQWACSHDHIEDEAEACLRGALE